MCVAVVSRRDSGVFFGVFMMTESSNNLPSSFSIHEVNLCCVSETDK